MRRVVLAAASLSVLAFALAAGGFGAGGVTPARAILSMTVEAPFKAPQPTPAADAAVAPGSPAASTSAADDWIPVLIGLVAVAAVGFGVVAMRQSAPVSRR